METKKRAESECGCLCLVAAGGESQSQKGSRKTNGRSGKKNIPAEAVTVLREWFDKHGEWPYPSQEQKEVSQSCSCH
jgi:hypothetical protein